MKLEWKISSVIIIFLLAALCLSAPASAQEGARVGFFGDLEIRLDASIEVPVEIRDVEELYAVDLTLRFDPEILEVEDADPDREGVQPGLATFLDAGMTLFNEVDNEAGIVRFVMSQINPSEGKSGDGILLVLYFTAKQAGSSPLSVEAVELSNRYGEAIAVSGIDAEMRVSADAPEVVATPIPVQDQSQIMVIQTLAPTQEQQEAAAVEEPAVQAPATNTAVPVESKEPTAEKELVEETGDEQPEEQGKGSLWWLAVLPLVIIAGVFVYAHLNKTKSQTTKEE